MSADDSTTSPAVPSASAEADEQRRLRSAGLPEPEERTPTDILRHAVAYLDHPGSHVRARPDRALYAALAAAMAAPGAPRAERVHAAVRAELTARHPDEPIEGALRRTGEREGLAGVRAVLAGALHRLPAPP